MIEEIAYGKINLAMNILGRRPDGYHEVDTVYQSVDLHDTVCLEKSDTFSLTCSCGELPCDESNLAYRAYKALLPFSEDLQAVRIHIEKRIPVAAGLAGGSADCAAVLRGLNRLWRLALPDEALRRIGRSLGADVPFCISGGTMRAGGIGEILVPLKKLPPWDVLIVHPHVLVHTDEAYDLFTYGCTAHAVDMGEMVNSVAAQDFESICSAMGNMFESLIMPHVPAVGRCKDMLTRLGLMPLMTGSGPTVFALVPPEKDGEEMATALREAGRNVDVIVTALR